MFGSAADFVITTMSKAMSAVTSIDPNLGKL
jgi:hypothetical protein